MLDPFYSRKPNTDDTVVRELANAGIGISRLRQRPGETDEDFREWQVFEGRHLRKRLEQTIESAEYRGADGWARDPLRKHAGWKAGAPRSWRSGAGSSCSSRSSGRRAPNTRARLQATAG